ncbi:MAG: ATP-dependent Clp protease ATP-binding subunit [Clostridiales bacterium]|nr:ATP-dependent Clp protease ATP-binding subunit [Clostridiales bacterium]
MKNIIIYFGPKKGLKKILPNHYRTLTEIVTEGDQKRNKILVTTDETNQIEELEYVENLVAYSEAYAGITEGAIQSFVSLLSRYDIDNLYLQNPTIPILHQVQQAFPDKIKIEKYKYKPISEKKFIDMYKNFSEHIIGQDQARERIMMSLYPLVKSRHIRKPIVLMFYGISGVGKTETAKFISDTIGEKLFRKQFSMFHSEEFASYLFGGTHMQSSFARDLLERESNVILIDEFDKPAPVFHSAFYQLFDEGVFEDKNYRVELFNSIIICTSNYQSEEDIQKYLGDPIFYRFDRFIKFEKLSKEAMGLIIEKLCREKYDKLTAKEKTIIHFAPLLEKFLGLTGGFKNVRHVSNIIDEYIGIILVRKFMESNE